MREEWQATRVGDASSAPEPVDVPGKPAAFAGDEAVRYTLEADDPRSGDDEVAVLHLEGCYAHTEVEVTGTALWATDSPVGHDVYFRPLRVPFRPDGDVRVAVTCEAPRDRFGGLYDTERVPETERVPGIWWAAELESQPLPYVDRLDVRPEVTDDGAVLDVSTTVVTDGPIEDRITYSLRPAGDLSTRGTMERATVATDGPGKTTVTHEIEVLDAALWWPRDLGEQHRYTLRASLGESERAVTTGICRVERDGSEFQVNGEPLRIRGVNLTTAATADVERALECRANLVRGHAQVLPPAIYEACDEAGLLVWQDLPLTGPGDFDVDRGRELATAIGETYGRHPSLAIGSGHVEPTDAFAEGLGDGLLDGLRLRWRAWRTNYDATHAERIVAAFPVDIPTFPVVGDPGTGAAARRLFPGWDYADAGDVLALLDRYPGDVVAAFGAGSMAAADGEPAADGGDVDGAKHAARVASEASPGSSQASVVETVAAALRREGVGAVVYALRDAGDGGMGVYAADGEAKPAQSALAAVYEPVRAFLENPRASRSTVVVCNDGPVGLEADLHWSIGEETGTESLTVAAAGRREAGPIDLPSTAETATLAVRTGAGAVEHRYDLPE